MPTTKRRVVLYARVSRDQFESRSVGEQFDELRSWSTRKGWEVVAEHSDTISASRYSKKLRPGWQSVMELINTGQVDSLLVWEISRTSRDRPIYAALLATCVDNGVMLGVDGRLHDPADPDSGFLLDLSGALAVRESAMTSKRTRRDVEARALLGRPHGSLPYGYRRVINPETGAVIGRAIHPEQGPVVREIVKRLLRHEPAQAIAKDLNAREIRTATGKEWRGGNLSILATRPTYAGLRVHHGQVLEDVAVTWEPLISVEDHHALVAMFASPDRDKWRNSVEVKHLGTGLFRCGREGCDGVMRVALAAGKPNAYTCRACFRTSRIQHNVDGAVEALLVARLSRPDALAAFASEPDDGAATARAEEVRLNGKLAAARQAWEDDELSLSAYQDMERRLAPKIKKARERARPRQVPEAVAEIAGPDAAKRWEAAPVTARRAVLSELMTVTIKPLGRSSPRNGRKPVEFDPAQSLGIEWKV